MKNNAELQKDVQDAIKWEPLLNAAEIGVTVEDGVVTLTGMVSSYAKKIEAENAAKNVAGVKAVVEKIIIKYNTGYKNDNDIATDVLNALNGHYEIPKDKIKVKVENGWVTLEGTLLFNYQKIAAQKAIINLMGVIGVSNDITIKASDLDKIEKSDIENALMRNWSIDDNDIEVEVIENKVTLCGTVKSWYEKDEAERIAWNAPGVWSVDNQLEVTYNYEFVD